VKRLALLAAIAAAALAAGARAGAPPTVLTWSDGVLAVADARTLRPQKTMPLAEPGGTVSPDRRTLVVSELNGGHLDFVDLTRMRRVGGLELPAGSFVHALHFIGGDRLLVLTYAETPQLHVVDVSARRVVATRSVPGEVVAYAQAPRSLVMLVAPSGRIGPARLVAADRAGEVRRSAPLPIAAGHHVRSEDDIRTRRPALAVDPSGTRAVVVDGDSVAEVRLADLRVVHHRLRTARRPAKSAFGSERWALWVGSHSVAVAAWEHEGIVNRRSVARALGVSLIDTRTWRSRTLSREASGIAVSRDVLIVSGGPYARGSSFAADRGAPVTGLTAFDATGKRLFRAFGDRYVGSVETAHGLAYVRDRARGRVEILDAATGAKVGSAAAPADVFILG
jgi:hypothetical protein